MLSFSSMRMPSGPPPTRFTKTSGLPAFSGSPLAGIFTSVSCAVLATNIASCLLLNHAPFAPMAGRKPGGVWRGGSCPNFARAAILAYFPDDALMRVRGVDVACSVEAERVETGMVAGDGHEHGRGTRFRIDR